MDVLEEMLKKNKSKEKSKNNKKPEKNEKIENPKEFVLNYMKNQNRPYSLINIFDNLHGAIKKSQLQNILDSLTKEEKLIMKIYGSTKIYLCNQNLFPSVSEEELNSLDKKINEKKDENKIIKDNINLKTNELKTITNSFTDEELNKKIKELKKEIEIKKKKSWFN